jgi:head-tail adaptor
MQVPQQQPTQPAQPPFWLFRNRVDIIELTEVSDGYGGLQDPVETVIATAWCAIEKTFKTPSPRLGTEHAYAGTIEGTAFYKVTMWYNPDITIKHWIRRSNGKMLNIYELNNVEEQDLFLEMFCFERTMPTGGI